MVILAVVFRILLPKINNSPNLGYKTPLALSSLEARIKANEYSSKIFLITTLILFCTLALVILTFKKIDNLLIYSSFLSTFIPIFITLLLTEIHLKNNLKV
jgi:hypothetical protein